MFSDESRFQLCSDDHRRRVWRRPWYRVNPAFTIARRPQPEEDKARLHAAHVAMNCLTVCQTLPWPARSPNLSSIKHVWDMMRRRLHQPGDVDDLAQ
ncbi:transposable element Tc1 transposase [Trichonephila clavipes]|nr:transposable element Tc1 transposase [Trichonephila clavipes]